MTRHKNNPEFGPDERPFTMATPFKLTAQVAPVILNMEFKDMQAARRDRLAEGTDRKYSDPRTRIGGMEGQS